MHEGISKDDRWWIKLPTLSSSSSITRFALYHVHDDLSCKCFTARAGCNLGTLQQNHHLIQLSIQRLVHAVAAVRPSSLREKSLQEFHHRQVWVSHGQLKPQRVEYAAFRDQNLFHRHWVIRESRLPRSHSGQKALGQGINKCALIAGPSEVLLVDGSIPSVISSSLVQYMFFLC